MYPKKAKTFSNLDGGSSKVQKLLKLQHMCSKFITYNKKKILIFRHLIKKFKKLSPVTWYPALGKLQPRAKNWPSPVRARAFF